MGAHSRRLAGLPLEYLRARACLGPAPAIAAAQAAPPRRAPRARWPRAQRRTTALLTLVERPVVRERWTGVDLGGPRVIKHRIFVHLVPVGDPSGGAANREHDVEHVR